MIRPARICTPRMSTSLQSYDWCTEHRDELSEKRSAAARAMFDKHEAEQRAAGAGPPRGREAW
jgi:hypothetical protein